MKKTIAIVIFLAVSILVAATPVHGDDGEEEARVINGDLTPSKLHLLEPIHRLLSGRMGLIAAGIDPLVSEGAGDFGGLDLQAGPVGLVPFRSPAPAFSRGILISRDLGNLPYQTEPHLAVDPTNPDHLIMGTIDYNSPTLVNYVSRDGGVSWEGPFPVPYPIADLATAGDPVMAFDRNGKAYIIGIGLDIEEVSIGPALLVEVVSDIFISASEDGGFNWADTVQTARSRVYSRDLVPDELGRVRGTVVTSFYDKPWMAIGPNPRDMTRDVIYVTFTEFILEYQIGWIGELPFLTSPVLVTAILMVKSEDGGKTWSEPVNVSPYVRKVSGQVDQPADTPPEVAGNKRVVQGSYPVVGPDGTLYVGWYDSTDDDTMEGLGELYIARSDDAGDTFTGPMRVSVFNETGFTSRSSSFRSWGSMFPRMEVGPKGDVYIVHTARPSTNPQDDGDIFFLHSEDKGNTWSAPLRINGDDSNGFQFFPAVAVDPMGNIHAMWGDTRDDPSNIRYHIYYTSSEDRGRTWGFEFEDLGFREADARVSDFPSNPNKAFPRGRFIGDYFAIKATEEDVYMVWADSRLGEYGGPNQKIGFARRRSVASPDIFLNPSAGPGGQEVTLQGFNFQPDINVFIRVGGVLVSTNRTNSEGRFTSQVFIPISGEGGHSVEVFDDSGNFATSSFFMEFGFDSIQRQLAALNGGPSSQGIPGNSPGGSGLSNPVTTTGGSDDSGSWAAVGWVLVGVVVVLAVALIGVLFVTLRVRRGF